MNPLLKHRHLAAPCAIVIATALAAIYTVVNQEAARAALTTWGYPLTVAMFTTLVLAFGVLLPRSPIITFFQRHKREVGIAIVVAVLGSVVSFRSLEWDLRVPPDEAQMLNTAKHLYEDKQVSITISSLPKDGRVEILHSQVPRRPLLYQSAVALLHSVFGYNVDHGFHVNFVVLSILLFGSYLAVWFVFRRRTLAIAMVGVILCQPVVHFAAVSSHFDLLSALTIFGLLVTTIIHLQKPSPEALAHAFVWATAACHVRYETPAVVLLVALILLASRSVKWRDIERYPLVYAIFLPLYLPRLWTFLLRWDDYNPIPGGDLFSWLNIKTNLATWWMLWGDFSFKLPFNPLVNIAGAIGALWFAQKLWQSDSKLRTRQLWVALTVIGVIATQLAIYAGHRWGRVDDPLVARLFLVPTLAMCWGGIYLLSRLRLQPMATAAVILGLFVAYHPRSTGFEHLKTAYRHQKHKDMLTYLEQVGPKQETLVVTRAASFLYPYGYAAIEVIQFGKFLPQVKRALQEQGLRRIILVQEVAHTPNGDKFITPIDGPFRITERQRIKDAYGRTSVYYDLVFDDAKQTPPARPMVH